MFNNSSSYFSLNATYQNNSDTTGWGIMNTSNTNPPTPSPISKDNNDEMAVIMAVLFPLAAYCGFIITFLWYHNHVLSQEREENNQGHNNNLVSNKENSPPLFQEMPQEYNQGEGRLRKNAPNNHYANQIAINIPENKNMPSGDIQETCEKLGWALIAFFSAYGECFFEAASALGDIPIIGLLFLSLISTPYLFSINHAESRHMLKLRKEYEKRKEESDRTNDQLSNHTLGGKGYERSLTLATYSVVGIAAFGDAALIGSEVLRAFEERGNMDWCIAMLALCSLSVFSQAAGGAGYSMLHKKYDSIFHEDREYFHKRSNNNDPSTQDKVLKLVWILLVNTFNTFMHVGYTLPIMHKVSEALHDDEALPKQAAYMVGALLSLIYLFDKSCLYGDDFKHIAYNSEKLSDLYNDLKKISLNIREKALVAGTTLFMLLGIGISGAATYFLSMESLEDMMNKKEYDNTGHTVGVYALIGLAILSRSVQMLYSHALRTVSWLTPRPDENNRPKDNQLYKTIRHDLHNIIERVGIHDLDSHKDNKIIPISAFSRQYRRILLMITVALAPVMDAYFDFTEPDENVSAYFLSALVTWAWLTIAYNNALNKVEVNSEAFCRNMCSSTKDVLLNILVAVLVLTGGMLFETLIQVKMDDSLSKDDKDQTAETISGLFLGSMVAILSLAVEYAADKNDQVNSNQSKSDDKNKCNNPYRRNSLLNKHVNNEKEEKQEDNSQSYIAPIGVHNLSIHSSLINNQTGRQPSIFSPGVLKAKQSSYHSILDDDTYSESVELNENKENEMATMQF